VIGCALGRRRWREAVVCGLLFLSGPLIFTNLHYVHNYYGYANELFAVALVGFAVVSCWNGTAGARHWVRVVAPGCRDGSGCVHTRVYLVQSEEAEMLLPTAVVRQVTEPSDVVLIYGGDWASVIPYYAQRRALMDRDNRPFSDAVMQAALARMQSYRVGAAVFCGYTAGHQGLIQQAQQAFGLSSVSLARVAVGGARCVRSTGVPA